MSIDLAIKVSGPLRLRGLFPDIVSILQEILGANSRCDLVLDILEKGHRIAAATDELSDRSSPYFLLSIRGERETVGLLSDSEVLTVSIGAERTGLEYALGAATAIAAARKSGALIEDDWRFFGDSVQNTGDDLLDRLKSKRARVAPGSIHEVADRMFAEELSTGEDSG